MNFPTLDPSLVDTFDHGEDKVHDVRDPRRVHEVARAIKALPASQEKTLHESLALIKEKFPRIFNDIKSKWGKTDLHMQLTNMLVGDVQGREGFPPDVAKALMMVYVTHMDQHDFQPIAVKYFKRDTW